MIVGHGQEIVTAFRVEEYKKPEYTVSILPEKTQVRTGETVKANVTARYYFGAPVMRAKVHYRVLRSYHITPRPFPAMLDWYDEDVQYGYGSYYRYDPAAQSYTQIYGGFQRGGRGRRHRDGRGGTGANHVLDGAAETAQGHEISARLQARRELHDYRRCDRRQPQTGFRVGSVTATAAEFHAYLRLDRQFVTMGDNVKIEAKTRDGSDKPFSAKGYVHFTRLIPAIPQVRVRDPETLKWKIVQPYVPPREEPDGSLIPNREKPHPTPSFMKEGANTARREPPPARGLLNSLSLEGGG